MNRFSSIFSQLLQLFPRLEFQQLVVMTKAERHAKGFSCWSQFVSIHSTLAYANEHRPWELYQQLFLRLFDRSRVQV
jgi:hypothetical protein